MSMLTYLKIICLTLFISCNAYAAAGAGGIDPDITPAHVETAKRFLFAHHLNELKKNDDYIRAVASSEVFVAYVWTDVAHKEWVTRLCEDLVLSGFSERHILFDEWANRPGGKGIYGHVDKLYDVSKVILVGNPAKDITADGRTIHYPSLREKYDSHEEGRGGVVSQELNILRLRIKDKGPSNIIPTYYEGSFGEVFPLAVQHMPGRFLGADSYFTAYFDLLQDLVQEHISAAGPSNPLRAIQTSLASMLTASRSSILKSARDIKDGEVAAALATARTAEDILSAGIAAHYS